MANNKTTVTELVTGLGMLGLGSIEDALRAEPRQMVSVSPERWRLLGDLYSGGALSAEFSAAWSNGQAFLRAADGLRGRVPLTIEWKGGTKAPGDEVVPADLRIDHVYLVSCKYLSKILHNVSPHYLFERLLAGGQGQRGADWYLRTAENELTALYGMATAAFRSDVPSSPRDLSPGDRLLLTERLGGRWPLEARDLAKEFSLAVSSRTASIWMEAMDTESARERFLWRLLRIGSAPYFVLGSDGRSSLRLRIQTPWDWKQQYRLRSWTATPGSGEQPIVGWAAEVEDHRSGSTVEVTGHVEIRWSHKKFCGAPEAKLYLDTPHHRVPGYVQLV